MTRPLTRMLLIACLATASLFAGDEKMCQAPARECEQQIRQMLSGRRYLGVQLVEIKPGLTIKAVLPNSPAARAQLKEGDRLIAVNGQSIVGGTAQDFKKILASAKETGTLWMIIQRRGAFRKVEVRLEPYSKEQIDKIIAAHMLQSHQAAAGSEP